MFKYTISYENKPPLEPEHASPHLRLVFFEGVFSVEYPKLPNDIGLYWYWREMMEVKGPKEKIELRNLKRILFCNLLLSKSQISTKIEQVLSKFAGIQAIHPLA